MLAIAEADWTQLSALGALILVVVWGVTKGIPGIVERFTESLNQQRTDFREELRLEREQSRILASAINAAVSDLANAVRDLREPP